MRSIFKVSNTLNSKSKFLNIGIIIVNDGSFDKRVKVINELIKEEQKINLIRNNKNREILYTKSKVVLNGKGNILGY